jgi:Dolichyl-phosphate-mannose-protein mannosyltransferase
MRQSPGRIRGASERDCSTEFTIHPVTTEKRARLASGVTLAALVVLAAVLRFTGLSWGLRHPPHVDEAVYVANVVEMVKAGDLDHRFYTYPGLFFYLLAPGVAALGPERWDGSDPYLVSRALVAAVGVLNVALLYAVGARLLGRGAGLAAAALLAVSPVDVETSHQVRPDVLLEGFGIAALLVFRRVGARLRDDAGAGLLIGLATAVKFTGLLMVPFYVAVRVLRPGPRVRGLAVAAALAVFVPVLATPYSLIHLERYRRGPGAQLDMYYSSSPERPPFARQLGFYAGALRRALGTLGALLALLGAALLVRRSWRDWLPPLFHPSTVLVVMATAAIGWPRLILPGMGILYLCAAQPIGTLGKRWPVVAGGLALLAVLSPLAGSAAYANLARRPWPADEALDWIEANVPAGARLLETREDAARGRGGALEIGVDPARHELVTLRPDKDRIAIARLIPHMDFVITDRSTREAWADRVNEEQVFRHPLRPRRWPLGEPVPGPVAIRVTRPRHPALLEPLDLSDAVLLASEDAPHLPALLDGDPASVWTVGTAKAEATPAERWLEIRLPRPIPVAVVELRMADGGTETGPPARLHVLAADRSWKDAAAVDARPPFAEQRAAARRGSTRPLGQRLVLDGGEVPGLRLVWLSPRKGSWALSDLRIEVLSAGRP